MIGSVMAHSTAADRAHYIIHAAIIIITTALGGTARAGAPCLQPAVQWQNYLHLNNDLANSLLFLGQCRRPLFTRTCCRGGARAAITHLLSLPNALCQIAPN
jgi:hypothetical protein